MKVGVLFGGVSTERNVSITGGKAIVKALEQKDYEVIPIDPAFGADGKKVGAEEISNEELPPIDQYKELETKKYIECVNSEIFDDIDVVFIVLHGSNGEDGKIQSLLELKDVPYTGSKIKASALSIDKNISKMLFMALGVITPEWTNVTPKDFDNFDFLEEVRSRLGSHIVVKPNNQGSTFGITILDSGNLDDMKDAVNKAGEYSDLVMIEQYIPGREITVGIVGEDILPVIEIIPKEGFYDYEHKYVKGRTEYVCPAEIDENLTEFIQDAAHVAFQSLGCEGFGRADFRLNEEGQPFLLEINTIPGFTDVSLVPMAAKEIGLEFPELCDKIIQLALNKQ